MKNNINIVSDSTIQKESNLDIYNFETKEYDGMELKPFLSCIKRLFNDLQKYSKTKSVFYKNTINTIKREFDEFPRFKNIASFKNGNLILPLQIVIDAKYSIDDIANILDISCQEVNKQYNQMNKERSFNEYKKNLTEKGFSNIMIDIEKGNGLFFRKIMSEELYEKYCIKVFCLGDRNRDIGSKYLTPTYGVSVYKKNRDVDNEAKYEYSDIYGDFNKEIWKTYWFDIRNVKFRLSENYNENIKNNKEWFAKLKSKEIYQYNTINELQGVLEKIEYELFN